MRIGLLVSAAATLLAVAFAISAESEKGVQIAVLTEANWDEFVPAGKEVDAIYGDLVIRNSNLTAIIARPIATRNANMTVRNVAGCLIDLADRQYESDQLSCLYPAGNDVTYRDWMVALNDGERRPVGDELSLQGTSGAVTVIAVSGADRPAVQTTYRLNASSTSLEMITEYQNSSKKTLTFVPVDLVRADAGKERMPKAPNGTGKTFWFDDQFWQQAYVLTSPQHQIQANSNSRTSTLKYLDSQSRDMVALRPGKSMSIERHLSVGRTYLDALQAAGQGEFRRGTLMLTDREGNPVSDATVSVKQGGNDYGLITTGVDGKATSFLPLGEVQFTIQRFGHPVAGGETSSTITAGDGDLQIKLPLEGYSPGTLALSIADDQGRPLPSKIEITGIDGTATPDFGPETAEFGVKNLRYTNDGTVSQALNRGKYLLRVSRGPEYSAEELTIEVTPKGLVKKQVVLNRLIDTTGWVSADFHSHSTPSGDNTSSQRGRVLNLVCEHIEFAPCTEHNRIDTYQPHFDNLKINSWISSVTGMELTGSPLPLNHQNVFPLHHHPHHQDGGGPVTDGDVSTQVRRIATWDNGSDKLIQQNHPDVGWLVYDKNGDGDYDEGHADGVALLDVMEIHPIQRVIQTGTLADVTANEAKGNRIFKWMQMLNQGYRIPGVVNTDAHYNFHGSGWIRNWIASTSDEPAKIDYMEMVYASEAGQIVMSNGPFLKMTAKSKDDGTTAGVGQDLKATSKQVSVSVSVQCPNWHSVDTVFILLNGRTTKELTFTTDSNPDLFIESGAGTKRVQKFDKTVELQLDEDTHVIAVAAGTKSELGPVVGPQHAKTPPAAFTNPIFIDIDGDGFTANRDKLGRPLPVKGD